MTDKVAICWFRQDLRVSDNPALVAAAKHNNVLPIYILDNENPGDYAYGGASQWWLHHSLTALQKSLGGQLSVYQGNPQAILQELISRLDVGAVYWNRCYEPWRLERDMQLKTDLKSLGLEVKSFNGSFVWNCAKPASRLGGRARSHLPSSASLCPSEACMTSVPRRSVRRKMRENANG